MILNQNWNSNSDSSSFCVLPVLLLLSIINVSVIIYAQLCNLYSYEVHTFLSGSSCPEVFCKEGGLRNFAKFTGKHLCQSLSFNKVAGLRPATFLKRRLWHRCFPVNFAKSLRTPFLIEHLGDCFCLSLFTSIVF